MNRNRYVITGGPGVGKTALINELERYGFQIVHEEARSIIKRQVKTGGDGLPWKDKSLYAELMLNASLQTYRKVSADHSTETVFFDRGIIDTFCYMHMENIPFSEEISKIAEKYRYNKKVFILPPWKEIYENDNERKQTWEEAEFTFQQMKETYLKYNYEVIEVPKGTLAERLKFVIGIVNESEYTDR